MPLPAIAETGWVSIVSPTADERVSGQRAEVSISYNTGSTERVTRIELLVDGVDYGVKFIDEPVSRGIASFLIDSTKLKNGSHTFIAKVFSGDKLMGATSGTCRIGNLPVDVVAPSLSVAGLRNGQTVSGVTVVEIKAKDNVTSNPLVSIFIDDTLRAIKNTAPYTYTWDTTTYSNGSHKLIARAYDDAGNRSESEAVEVVVNNKTNVVVAAAPTSTKAEPAKPVHSEAIRVAEKVQESAPVAPIANKDGTATAASTVVRVSGDNVKSNTPIAKSDRIKPEVVASDPKITDERTPHVVDDKSLVGVSNEILANHVISTEPVADEPELTPVLEDEPSITLPVAVHPDEPSPMVIASLPANADLPIATAAPSLGDPVETTAPLKIDAAEPALQSVSKSFETGQKLARPDIPQPTLMAMAPKSTVQSANPSLEPHKVKVTLQTSKQNGILVTELRSVIEHAGGTIIAWDNKQKIALAALDGRRISISIGQRTAVIDGESVVLMSAPYINQNGRTVVDTQFLKSLIGTRLMVDQQSGKCVLTKA